MVGLIKGSSKPPVAGARELLALIDLLSDPQKAKQTLADMESERKALNALVEDRAGVLDRLAKSLDEKQKELEGWRERLIAREQQIAQSDKRAESTAATLRKKEGELDARERNLLQEQQELDVKIETFRVQRGGDRQALEAKEKELADREAYVKARESDAEALRTEYEAKLARLKNVLK